MGENFRTFYDKHRQIVERLSGGVDDLTRSVPMLFSEKINSKKVKLFLLSTIIITLCLITAVFIGYRRILSKNKNLVLSIQSQASLSINKVHQTATRNGIKEWSLDASSAQYMDSKKQAIFKDLSVTFFLKDESEVYLTADHGILKIDTNDIETSGNVILVNGNYRLKTESLYYEHQNRKIITKVPVQITGNSSHFMADSMSFDLSTKQTLLEGKVEGIFRKNVAL